MRVNGTTVDMREGEFLNGCPVAGLPLKVGISLK